MKSLKDSLISLRVFHFDPTPFMFYEYKVFTPKLLLNLSQVLQTFCWSTVSISSVFQKEKLHLCLFSPFLPFSFISTNADPPI